MELTRQDLTRSRRDAVVHGRRIAYFDMGDHPRTCLLIHGFCASSQYWIYTIPKLIETHRVVAIDLPGFGDSELPREHGFDAQLAAVTGLCDTLGVGPVDVVGHSMGTWVACEMAARHPELVRSLVLTGGPSVSVVDLFRCPLRAIRQHPKETTTALIETATAWLPIPARITKLVTTRPWARRLAFAPYVRHPGQLPPAAVSAVLGGFGAPGALPTIRYGSGYDLRPALDRVRCPALVIAGSADNLVPESDVRVFVDADPTNRHLRILDDTGHMPMFEQSNRFNELISEFLNTSAAPAT